MARSQATFTQPLNPAQLAATVNAAVYTSGTTVQSDCDQPTLDSALAAYTYNAHFGESADLAGLRAIVATAQQVIAGTGSFTAPQIQTILAHLVLRMVNG